MAQAATRQLSPDEYLQWEEDQQEKHEYCNGRIYAMSGATSEHIRVTFNLTVALGTQLRGRPCEGFNADMRVKVSETGLYTYPDMVVVCGKPDFDQRFKTATLLNPTVIFEALSASTEAHDRGDKFAHYMKLDSLRGYVLISTKTPRIEHYERQEDGRWVLNVQTSMGSALSLPEIDCELRMDEVYARVDFPTLPH